VVPWELGAEELPVSWDEASHFGLLEKGPMIGGQHCWGEPSAQIIKVRGATYLQDQIKVPSGPPLYRLLAVDFATASRDADYRHMARHASTPASRLQAIFDEANAMRASCVVGDTASENDRLQEDSAGRAEKESLCGESVAQESVQCESEQESHDTAKDSLSESLGADSSPAGPPFVLVINFLFQFGSEKAGNMGFYFARRVDEDGDDAAAKLNNYLLNPELDTPEGDRRRSSCLKVIPVIREGPWIVKSVIPTGKPAIIAKQIKLKMHRGQRYFEIDIDTTTSGAGNAIIGALQGTLKGLVIDLAFVWEGRKPEYLPERLIGTVRLSHLDVEKAQVWKPPNLDSD